MEDLLGLCFSNKLHELSKKFTQVKVQEKTLTNNEIKAIIKEIKYLENRAILSKGSTNKITSQKGGHLNFLGPLIKTGLPLMNNLLTTLAKSVLVSLGLTQRQR